MTSNQMNRKKWLCLILGFVNFIMFFYYLDIHNSVSYINLIVGTLSVVIGADMKW